jgi:septum formation protein
MSDGVAPRIVLASASPRRRALLAALGLTFDVLPSNIEETFHGTPSEMVITNARAKRDDIASRVDRPSLVIAADTLVFLDDHVLGKPTNLVEAHRMLRMLSDRKHQVLTGLAIAHTGNGRANEGFESTSVRFRKLTEEEIAHFVNAVKPIDRAGAYTVDGPGSLLVAGYDGCYQNVLGLPIVRLDNLMRDLGYSLFDMVDSAKAIYL